MTRCLSFLTLMTLTPGPHVSVVKGNNEELECSHGCFHRAWKATGKPDSSKHHKLIITYCFSKATYLPAAKKSCTCTVTVQRR